MIRIKLLFLAALLIGICGCLAPARENNQELPQSNREQEPLPTAREPRKKFVVGLSWQGMTPYVQRLEKALLKRIGESGYEIEIMVMDGQENFEKQISQVESFVAHKADVILLNPSSYNELGPAVNAAADADIPIITMITRVREQSLCTSFVGSDHKESAVLEATMAARYLNERGTLLVLEGTVGIDARIARSAGYREVLEQFPDIRVIAAQPAFWEESEAYMITENMLYNGVRPDAILSQNDSMALGAFEAVKEKGLEKEIMVFGIDGDARAIQSVRDGGLVGTVFMDAEGQAERIMHCIDQIKAKKQPEHEYLVPFIVVSRDNIGSTFERTSGSLSGEQN